MCLSLKRIHRGAFSGLYCCCGLSIFLFWSIYSCGQSQVLQTAFHPKTLVWSSEMVVYSALLKEVRYVKTRAFFNETNDLFFGWKQRKKKCTLFWALWFWKKMGVTKFLLRLEVLISWAAVRGEYCAQGWTNLRKTCGGKKYFNIIKALF